MDHPISSVLTQAAQFTNVAPLATASGYASSDSASVASSVAGDTPVMPNGIFHSTPSSPEAASRKAYQGPSSLSSHGQRTKGR